MWASMVGVTCPTDANKLISSLYQPPLESQLTDEIVHLVDAESASKLGGSRDVRSLTQFDDAAIDIPLPRILNGHISATTIH